MKWKTISLTDKEGLELFCGTFILARDADGVQ